MRPHAITLWYAAAIPAFSHGIGAQFSTCDIVVAVFTVSRPSVFSVVVALCAAIVLDEGMAGARGMRDRCGTTGQCWTRASVNDGGLQVKKIADDTSPRKTLCVIGVAPGDSAGFANSLMGVDTSFTPSLPGWLLASLFSVVVLHEAAHAAVAALLGHKPLLGVRPPLVYVTLTKKVPRSHFMMLAIAPLVVLDLLFALLYADGRLTISLRFSSLIINTIGSVGDMWGSGAEARLRAKGGFDSGYENRL